jgi:hypothetical protein
MLRTESLAALGATPGEQAATALGGHAGAKTVGARAMQITGIECSFHSGTSAEFGAENFWRKQ